MILTFINLIIEDKCNLLDIITNYVYYFKRSNKNNNKNQINFNLIKFITKIAAKFIIN